MEKQEIYSLRQQIVKAKKELLVAQMEYSRIRRRAKKVLIACFVWSVVVTIYTVIV